MLLSGPHLGHLSLDLYDDCRRDVTHDGSIVVRGAHRHPNADNYGNIAEHRLVMAAMLCRPLRKRENVHHRSGCRSDNSPENLELRNIQQPAKQRIFHKLAVARRMLARYG